MHPVPADPGACGVSRDRLTVDDVRAAMTFRAAGPRTQEERIIALEARIDALEALASRATQAMEMWQRGKLGRKIMAMFGEVTDARNDSHDDRRGAVRGSPMGH